MQDIYVIGFERDGEMWFIGRHGVTCTQDFVRACFNSERAARSYIMLLDDGDLWPKIQIGRRKLGLKKEDVRIMKVNYEFAEV